MEETTTRAAVIGAGTMGSGIAQLCAMAGLSTALVDLDAGQLERAGAAIDSSLAKLESKGRLGGESAAVVRARITADPDLGLAVADADVVIETVVERLDIKQHVFSKVLANAPSNALLGTNTSQLSITAIASVLGPDAHRLVGLHFFNPPVLMNLVEIIAGLETSEDSLRRAEAFARSLGRETVLCRKDSPGFLTSRISALVRLECLRMLEEGIASPADIDKALRLAFNWPMGPLELGDFNGHDTFLHIAESLERSLGDRYRPTVTLRNLVSAGRLGRKSGSGIYDYDEHGTRSGGDQWP